MSYNNSTIDGDFNLDVVNVRKPIRFRDGTIQSTAFAGSGGSGSLSYVLGLGNSAGSNNINMNNQDITNANNIDCSLVQTPISTNSALLYFSPYNTTNPFSYWTYDLLYLTSSTSIALGNPAFSAIYLPAGFVVNNIFVAVNGSSSISVSLALYDENGTLLAKSLPTTSFSAEVNKIPLITPYTIPSSGIYYCAFLSNGSLTLFTRALGITSLSGNITNYPTPQTQVGTLKGYRSCNITGSGLNFPSSLSGLTVNSTSVNVWFAVS